MPLPSAPLPDETTVACPVDDGSLPPQLRGRYVRIGPNAFPPSTTADGQDTGGMVEAIDLDAGRVVTYRSRWITTDGAAHTFGSDVVPGPPAAGRDEADRDVVAFGGRLLACGSRSLAYELDAHLDTVARIDLAGRRRGIGAHPKLDRLSGALHLVSYGEEPAHHVVAPNRQTRTTVPLPDAPDALHDLLLTPMRVVLLGDAVVGVTDRTAGTPPVWVPGALRGAFAAWDLDGEVGVLSAGRSLVQWCVGGAGARPLVLDATPQGRAVTNPRRVGRPRFVWTTATDGTRVFRHDLRTGERTAHDLGPRRCTGPLAFAPDPARRHHEDGGWLVGLAHDDRTDGADLVVLDAGELGRPAITTARIPQRLPEGRRSTWVPSK